MEALGATIWGVLGGALSSIVVFAWYRRRFPKDADVDALIASVEELTKQSRRERMREVRAARGKDQGAGEQVELGLDPTARKAAIRARLRSRLQ